MKTNISPEVLSYFDKNTNTITHLVIDRQSKHCAIIDSVLDYNQYSSSTDTASADNILKDIDNQNLQLKWILETHIHADHLTAAQYIKDKIGGTICVGAQVTEVQSTFYSLFNTNYTTKNHHFDYLFSDEEVFKLGEINCRVIYTPGHTPACVSYLIGDCIFVGDTIFMPDYGTARCDFPGGSAEDLYNSIQKLYQLPDNTNMYLCHDYLPDGNERNEYSYITSIKEQKLNNIHINKNTTKDEFINMRVKRDKSLSMPNLIFQSVQVNMKAGLMPAAEDNGQVYFKIPVNNTSL